MTRARASSRGTRRGLTLRQCATDPSGMPRHPQTRTPRPGRGNAARFPKPARRRTRPTPPVPLARPSLAGFGVAGISRRRVAWVGLTALAAWIVVAFAGQVAEAAARPPASPRSAPGTPRSPPRRTPCDGSSSSSPRSGASSSRPGLPARLPRRAAVRARPGCPRPRRPTRPVRRPGASARTRRRRLRSRAGWRSCSVPRPAADRRPAEEPAPWRRPGSVLYTGRPWQGSSVVEQATHKP